MYYFRLGELGGVWKLNLSCFHDSGYLSKSLRFFCTRSLWRTDSSFFSTYILRTISSYVHIVILHALNFFVNWYSINFLHSCLDCNYIFPGVAETFSRMSNCTIWFHKYVIEPVESYFSKDRWSKKQAQNDRFEFR